MCVIMWCASYIFLNELRYLGSKRVEKHRLRDEESENTKSPAC